VFRGYDTERERLVAVKVFKLDALPPDRVHQLVASFERVIAADLSHPAIAQPIATGITGASAFLATEYVAADSLDLAVREFGASPPADALMAAASLAAALDQAAAVNITHGCLHPRDVLFSSQETRLTGLGVAQALEHAGVSVPVRRPYTAPERITGSQWHRRADVFSLAALVHELLWGRRISAAGEQAAEALSPITGDFVALKRAFARALARDPADRYATAMELVDAIRNAMPDVAAATPVPPSSTRRLRLAVNRSTQIDTDPMVVLEQPRFADLDIEPDEAMNAPLGPSILSLAPDGQDDEEPPLPAPTEQSRSEPLSVDPPAARAASLGLPEEPAPAGAPAPDAPDTAAAEFAAPAIALAAPPPLETLPVAASAVPGAVDLPGPEIAGASADHSILERSRSAVWPLLLALMIGVVLGFAGGYAVGLRDRPAAPQTAAAGPSDRPGREFTEGAVAETPRSNAAAPARKPVTVPAGAAARPESRVDRPQVEAVGRLAVKSTPPGARVFLDDRDVGRTPAAVRDLALGAHRVRLVREGYSTEDRRVVITRARPSLSMAVTLARVTAPAAAAAPPARAQAAPPLPAGRGALTVDSRPAGARVFLDGKAVGTTPMSATDVPAGDHAIRLEHDGYRQWSASVRITPGEQSRVTASLER
jgi:serine/threonine-protein kinase